MSLFQKSVTNKYLKNLDTEKVDKAFDNFQKFYGNKLRLANIMQLKEENYQEGFLREIFVQTLGYIINPDENFNLTTEFKNQKDARKADGAIVRNTTRGHVPLAVIELKSTKTKNLESIKEQAFGYKNNQPDCKYVITSNFQSLRFYVDNATEYEEFNLFQMNKEQFKLLYLLLSKESIFSDLPEKLKQETKFHENEISTQLYADYKHFKDKIFKNLLKNNPQYDKLTLFKKSQKLLDRFLFVFFAEDGGLIPPNAVSKIIEQWKGFIEEDEYFTLYSRFQKLFSHLDKGHTYKKWGEIPAYNGGLFRNDEILDSSDVKIDDEILEKDSLKLSKYDFNTEVDVNILGHIFEHSLNEIEEITAELHGEKIDKKKSKRKKDGVFYTPKYITKYIVENTVGTLCNEKKEELQIRNLLIDSTSFRKATTRGHVPLSKKGKKLFKTLNGYKDWLITLKILDPACGSGAFLNQTLDFLIAEHKQADDLIAELTGENLRLFDTDKAILENNIYGVDINEESVEIAKLSLWLRTAQKGRKLSDLSGNIKCGNSLIDDPEIAGEKAFDWEKEFPHVFNPEIKEKVYQKLPEAKPDYLTLIKDKTKEAQNKAEKSAKLSREAVEI
ncbi:MAG: DNA methyltransferase, partial [Bacteroidota bacterium]|nr:DNA methyltransferase [Bacteroidota bacterium]